MKRRYARYKQTSDVAGSLLKQETRDSDPPQQNPGSRIQQAAGPDRTLGIYFDELNGNGLGEFCQLPESVLYQKYCRAWPVMSKSSMAVSWFRIMVSVRMPTSYHISTSSLG